MQRGDKFDTAGYQELAHATSTEGGGPPSHQEIALFTNNSNCFILAWRAHQGGDAFVHDIYRYDMLLTSEEDTNQIYREALDEMIRCAKES